MPHARSVYYGGGGRGEVAGRHLICLLDISFTVVLTAPHQRSERANASDHKRREGHGRSRES